MMTDFSSFLFRAVPETPEKSFFRCIPAGLATGFFAALVPVLLAAFYGHLPGLVLFSSVCYVFLLERLPEFYPFSGFSRCCDALAVKNADPAARLAVLRDPHAGRAASVCGALLIGAKILAVYLIFMKTALFDSTMLLAFCLIFVPVLGRLAVLWTAYRQAGFPGASSSVLFAALALILSVGAFLLGFLTLGFASMPIQAFAPDGEVWIRLNAALARVSGSQLAVLAFVQGVRALLPAFVGTLAAAWYWRYRSGCKFGGVTLESLGAACETAELAALAGFLCLIENLPPPAAAFLPPPAAVADYADAVARVAQNFFWIG